VKALTTRFFSKTTVMLVVAVVFVYSFTQVAFAQSIPSIPNPVNFPDFESIINFLLGLIRPIVLLTLIATLMYGGFVYLTAHEDDKKVGNAKKIMTAAIVGFVIVVLAPVIVQLVGSLLGVRAGFLDINF